MLLKQLPSIVCAIAATWFAAGVAAQDDDNVKSIPVSLFKCIFARTHGYACYLSSADSFSS